MSKDTAFPSSPGTPAQGGQAEKLAELMARVEQKQEPAGGGIRYISTAAPRHKNMRSFVLPYIQCAPAGPPVLRLVYNYTGTDWIFFSSATVTADEKTYQRPFNYFQVNRETVFGAKLSEQLDTPADTEDVEMLRRIARSNRAVIRLKGDRFHRDIPLSSFDKQAIGDILALYELLSSAPEALSLL